MRALPEHRPTMFADSMAGLLDDAAVCVPSRQGGFDARFEGDVLVISGGTASSTPIESLRTAASVAWAEGAPEVAQVRAEGEHAARVLERWS